VRNPAQQKLGEVENHARAIFVEAMHRVGEMLRETERNPGGRRETSTDLVLVSDKPPTLELGGENPEDG
jgi:hypothetical protein